MKKTTAAGLVSVPRFTGGGRSYSLAAKKTTEPELLGVFPFIAAAIYSAVKLAQVDKRILAAFSELYTENWLKNLGISYDRALEIVRAAVALYKAGYSRDRAKIKEIRDIIAAKLGTTETAPISKILFYLEDIKKENYPTLFDYMTPQGQTLQSYKTAISQTGESAVKATKESVKDTLQEAGALVQESLPWYAKPKIILGGVVIVGVLYALTMAKQFLPKRNYQSNPVNPKRAQAEKMYKTFHDKKPTKVLAISEIDTSELVHLGDALEIGYRSKKWTGKNANYLHEFGKKVKLYTTADGKHLVIGGGAMAVKDTGINN